MVGERERIAFYLALWHEWSATTAAGEEEE
jgi:hypothetical protein